MVGYKSEVMKYEIEIDLSRDSLLHENSISLFKKSYLQKNLGETSPQHRYACIASVLGSNQEHAQRLYEWMSKLYLSPSTPMALMNPLNRGHLPASCFLTCVEDTREGLVSSLLEDAYLSMSGGGIGQYFDTRSADDKSTGKKPHISVLNNLIDAYKQASRRGAVAIYLDITDSEIESFIGLRDPKKSKDLNLHHGVNITDDFMRAVINGEKVELKCNKKGTVTGVVDATELLCRILEMRAKFGEPYIHFIDTSNRLMPEFQKKQGLKIKQSNLCCVTGDTKAKTNFGDIRVDALVGYENIKYYSPTLEDYAVPKVPMTLISTNAKVYRVTLSDGKYIDVTEEHKHPILDGCEEKLVTTKELLEMRSQYIDMPSQSPSKHPRYLMPPVDKVLLRVDYVGGHTWDIKKDYNDDTILASYMPIQYIQELDERPVYCLTMPTEDTLWVANKICTGNSEITLPTGDGRTAVCFLSSLNLTHYDEIRANPQIIHDSIEMIDNAISLFISELEADLDEYKKTVGTNDERGHRGYAMRKALKGAKEERAIGLGVLGYHDYFQSKEIPIESPLCAGYTNSMFKYIREEAEVITKKLAEEKGSCPDAQRMGIVRRNSVCLSIAPNANSSILCGGTSPSIEPWNSNIFTQATSVGKFTFINKRLEKVLEKYFEEGVKGKFAKYKKWDTHTTDEGKVRQGFFDAVKSSILSSRGSVQQLDFLTPEHKKVFKTAIEIDQKFLIELNAIRQQHVDQAQSLNLFYDSAKTPLAVMLDHVFYAWSRGVKTLYYQRGRSEESADKIGERIKESTILDALEGKEVSEESTVSEINIASSDCVACEG
jgi:ribonucleotide reductase alpha subunit